MMKPIVPCDSALSAMGAGALSKEEAVAAAPGAGVVTFDDAAWEALEKDGDGKVSCETLKGVASKYAAEPAAAPAPPAAAAPAAATTDLGSRKYLYADNPEHGAEIEHLAPGGFGTGSFASTVQTPEGLAAAEKVLYKLHQVLDHEGDQALSGFGETYAAPTVNYYHMFKKIDLDGNRQIGRDEWVITMRRVLVVKEADVSDVELMAVYDAVDDNKNGTISLSEFAAFAKGARWTSPHHHQGHVRNTSWGLKDLGLTHPESDPSKLMPHYSDKKVTQRLSNAAAAAAGAPDEPAGLDALHLILFHLTQELAKEKMSRVSGIHKHPAKISYHDMFKKLNIDHNDRVTRENFALVLRRHVGVGAHVTDADLGLIFTEMDVNNNGAISFSEFAAYCKGAATPTMARGAAHHVSERKEKIRRESLRVTPADAAAKTPTAAAPAAAAEPAAPAPAP